MTTVGSLNFVIGGDRARLDQQLQQIRAEALRQPLQYKIVVDESASRRSLDAALKGLTGKEAKIKLSLDGQSIQAELTRLKALQTVTITVKMSGKQDIQNDVNTLKTLLGELRGNMQYRVTVNTTALSALNGEIHTQILQLQSLITQLRSLGNGPRPGPTPPGGGAGGGSSLDAATLKSLREIERLNNLWDRGQISAANYGQALTGIQARLDAAARAAGVGTAEFARIDAGISRITQSLRGMNTDAFQKLRTEAAGMRLAFDTATAGAPRNSAAFQAAVTTYNTASASLQARLQALVASGQLTTQQLGQVNREMARLGREAQSVAGGVNAAGFSGNIVNALRSVLPMLSQTGGALGAAAGQASMFGGGVMSAAAALGPFGVAVGVTTVAVALLTAGIGAAVNEYALFEKQMQGVKAVSDASGESFDALKTQAKDLALAYGQNVVEIGAVQEELFKAGRSIEDVLGGAAKAVTVLMQATGSDLTNAVKIAGSAMNTFGIKGQDMMRVSDAIANGANKTALDVHTLGIALQQVGNGASTAGMSLEETVAVLGLLADRGIQGSDAGTSLKVMLQRLTAGMPDVIAELKKYNVSVFDGTGAQRDMMTVLGDVIKVMDRMTDEQRGAFLQTVAGSDAQRVLAASYKAGTNSLKDYVAMMDDTGRAEKDAKTRAEGLIGAKNRLNTSIQVFKDNIGAIFAPAMTQMYEGLKGAVDQATRLAELLGKISGTGPKIEFTDMQKELNAAWDQLARERSNLASLTRTAEAQKRATGSVSDPIQDRLTAAQKSVAALESQVKVLELQVRTEAVAGGTFVGPVMPGQNQDGAQVVFNPKSTDALGAQVISAAAGKLGDVSADSIVDYCAKWVRLTLGKASPETASQINKLFQTDSNKDGQVTATDAARNALKAGFAQRYSGVQDLKPGDVVFYTEGGQNHTGIYIGNGMVRGNNRVTYAQNGGKFDQWGNPTSPGVNPVGDVAINKLGTPNWFMRPGEVLTQMGAKPAKITGAAGGGNGDAAYTGLTAAQIAQAQALQAAIDKAQKALNANPKDTALIKALDNAKEKAKAWGEKSDTNARALQAVTAAQSGLTKATGDYIATQADLAAHSTKALQLIKAQEAANASGNASRILAADNAVKAWQGESKAKAAVLQVERAAYQTRKQASEEAKRDAERDAADADRRAKEQATQRAAIAKGVREGQAQAAGDALAKLQTLNKMELEGFRGTAEQKLALTRKLTQEEYEAAEKVARIKRNNAIRDAENGPAQLRAQGIANANAAYENTVLGLKADRLSAVRAAQEAATAEQRAWNEALEEGVRAGNEALATLDQYVMGGRDLAATAQPLIPAEKTYAALEDRIISMKGELADPTTLTAWTEVIQGFGEAGRLSAVQVQNLIDLMTELHEGPGAEWAREFAEVQARDDLRYGNGEAATDAAMRGSYGVGAEGLAAALKGYGVRSVEELLTINPTAAASIQRVYAGVFAQMNADMEAGAVQSLAILDYYRAEADRIADQTATAADNAVSNKDAQDADLVARYKRLGPGMMLAYLGGAGNDFFGDKFFTQLGETGRAKFLEALDSFTPEDFAQVPESLLSSITAQIGESPEWAALKSKIKSAIKVQVETNSTLTTGGNNAAAAEAVKAADELAGNGQYVEALGVLEAALTDLWAAASPERGEDAADAINVVTDAMNRLGKAGGVSLKAANDKLSASQRALNVAMGEKEQPYADQIRGLEDLREKIVGAGGATDAIDKLIAAWRQLQKQAQLTDLAGQIASAAQGMGELFDKISGSDAKGALSILGDYMQMNVTAYKQFQSGDIVGAVMTSLNGILNIGESIAELNSGLREWKKNLREVAQEQQKALGLSTGGIKSPWQDALKADMEAQEKLANSKWYQRLAWSIFGGAPQAMKTESAKALAEMQTIFAGFAEGFSGILTNTLTDAFNKGDMAGWAENFSKSFDAQVGQLILKTIIQAAFETGAAANDLGELTKAVKEERYSDIPPILTRLKATAGNIGAGIAAIAPSLPGYGAGADDNETGVGGGVMFGSAPGASLGLARVELTLPPIFTAAMDTFSGAAPVFAEGSNTLLRAARLIEDAFRTNGGPPRLSGNGGLT